MIFHLILMFCFVTPVFNAEGCDWFGSSPFCDGECPFGYTQYFLSQNGKKNIHGQSLIHTTNFGGECWSGHKAYCCMSETLATELPEEILEEAKNAEMSDDETLFGEEATMRSESDAVLTEDQQSCLKECGILLPHTPANPTFRLDEGHNTPEGAYPWSVKIVSRYPSYCTKHQKAALCTGSLISNKWIFSSAHCFYYDTPKCELLPENKEFSELHLPVNDEDVYIHFRTGQDDESVIKSKKIHRHPEFKRNQVYFEKYDVALVELSKPVTFTTSIRPICLPSSYTPVTGTMSLGSGYGIMNDAGQFSESLRELMFPLRSDANCKKAYKDFDKSVVGCAGDKFREVQQGDSGSSPAVSINGRWYALGAFSRGTAYPDSTIGPSLYSKTTSVCAFIQSVTQSEVKCVDPNSNPSVEDCVETLQGMVRSGVVVPQTPKAGDAPNANAGDVELGKEVQLDKLGDFEFQPGPPPLQIQL